MVSRLAFHKVCYRYYNPVFDFFCLVKPWRMLLDPVKFFRTILALKKYIFKLMANK